MNLSAATGPNPPWTGLYFTCEECGAHYQLGASDELKPIEGTEHGFMAQPCWTCGHRQVVTTAGVITKPSADVTIQRFNDSTEAKP